MANRLGAAVDQAGRPVQKFGKSKLDATTLAVDAGLNLPIWEAVTCRRPINYGYATRLPTTRQIPG
jgi:hypothetical protein